MSQGDGLVASPVTRPATHPVDDDRRFGGLLRLYGPADYAKLRALRVAVVGLGGVGSWAVEALARSGVAALTLIDYDHVAESNINRQIQATSNTLGQAKGEALRDRVALIHPACHVHCVDAFASPDNWPQLLPEPVDVVIDACDQVRAKVALGLWSLASGVPLVCAGAAGGKRDAASVETGDLVHVTHDPLLASLRSHLRRSLRDAAGAAGAATVQAATPSKELKALGVACVFSREPTPSMQGTQSDGSLNCHGYGSSVMVTASFGMTLAAEAVRLALSAQPRPKDFLPFDTSAVGLAQNGLTS